MAEITPLYGVGLSALKSKTIGNIQMAAAELVRMVEAGANPKFLRLIPVRVCPQCNGKGSGENAVFEYACELCNEFRYIAAEPTAFYNSELKI